MKNKPRICAVGMFSDILEIQLQTLINLFSKYDITSIKTTKYQNNFIKFFDIIFFLVHNRSKYDVIHVQAHSHFNIISVIIALSLAKIFKKKIVIMYYGGGAKEFFRKSTTFFKYIFSKIDEIVVAGNYVKSAFDELNIKTTIIPHIIDVESWNYRQRISMPNQLLWIRHLRQEYNPLMVLKVFKSLSSIYPDLKLIIVGTGLLKDSMDKYIYENEIHNITFLGRVTEHKLRLLYEEADVFINTSSIDNQPVTVLEALTSGCPVVSTNPGGVGDIISHKETGLLCYPNDMETMTQNIRLLFDNNSLSRKLSLNGRKYILASFSDNAIMDQWDLVYRRLGYYLINKKVLI